MARFKSDKQRKAVMARLKRRAKAASLSQMEVVGADKLVHKMIEEAQQSPTHARKWIIIDWKELGKGQGKVTVAPDGQSITIRGTPEQLESAIDTLRGIDEGG